MRRKKRERENLSFIDILYGFRVDIIVRGIGVYDEKLEYKENGSHH